MALSAVQKGAVGVYEFLQTAIITGRGAVEVALLATEDDPRDAEIHRMRHFGNLAVQIKIATVVLERNGHRYLNIVFQAPRARIVSDATFWYFFAYFDLKTMRFVARVFLMPSSVVHKICRRGPYARRGQSANYTRYSFMANIDAEAVDRWHPYRVSTGNLGARIQQILNDLPKQSRLSIPVGETWKGMVVMARRREPARRRLGRAA